MNHFTTKFWIGCGFAAIAGLLLASASAQTPPPGGNDVVLSGFLTCPVSDQGQPECPFRLHYVHLLKEKSYAIRMDSSEFRTSLTLEDMHGKVLAADIDCFDELNGSIVFRPPTTGEYRLIATSAPATSEGFYTITIRELPILLRVEAALSPRDATSGGAFLRTHEVALTQGQRYIIDMESGNFDPYVKLLNSDGAIVAFNDEGYIAGMARIVFTAPRTETYLLVTTSRAPFATGAFALTVCVD
jgi:hypothetical protein